MIILLKKIKFWGYYTVTGLNLQMTEPWKGFRQSCIKNPQNYLINPKQWMAYTIHSPDQVLKPPDKTQQA